MNRCDDFCPKLALDDDSRHVFGLLENLDNLCDYSGCIYVDQLRIVICRVNLSRQKNHLIALHRFVYRGDAFLTAYVKMNQSFRKNNKPS